MLENPSFLQQFKNRGGGIFHINSVIQLYIIESRYEISNNVLCATSKG